MLYYVENLPIAEVSVYHNEQSVKKIKERYGFKKLEASIVKDGILHPVLARSKWGELEINVREQRLLVAQKLGIETFSAFVFNDYQGVYAVRITKAADVLPYFNNDPSVPTCKSILKYIHDGQIKDVEDVGDWGAIQTNMRSWEEFRAVRLQEFRATMWIAERQQTSKINKGLTNPQYFEWCDYWDALREAPEACGSVTEAFAVFEGCPDKDLRITSMM